MERPLTSIPFHLLACRLLVDILKDTLRHGAMQTSSHDRMVHDSLVAGIARIAWTGWIPRESAAIAASAEHDVKRHRVG